MSQRRFVVGTEPVLLADSNRKRTFISVILLPTDIEIGNTGRLHIGKGFTPVATVGAPNQGDILQQGGEFSDESKYKGDTSVFKGQLWAVASAAGQIAFVDEASEESPVINTIPTE